MNEDSGIEPAPAGELSKGQAADAGSGTDAGEGRRRVAMVAYLVVLTAAFLPALIALFRYAASEELHSHTVLIPVVTGWLLWTGREGLKAPLGTSVGGAAFFLVLGVLGLAVAWDRGGGWPSSAGTIPFPSLRRPTSASSTRGALPSWVADG